MNGLSVAEERALVERALSPEAMRRPLATIAGVGTDARCQVLDAKYEALRSFTALYRIGARQATVTARLDRRADPAGGGSLLEPGVRAFLFPEDPAMAGLDAILQPAAMSGLLSDALNAPVRRCRLRVLRYRPAKRLTLDVRARLGPGVGSSARYIAKIYSNPDKASAVFDEARRMSELIGGSDAPAATAPGRLVVAGALAFVPAVPMILQSPVTGRPLEELVAGAMAARPDGRVAPAIRSAARALAQVHALPPISTRHRSAETELARFAQRAERITAVDPAIGEHLSGAVQRLVEHGPDPTGRTVVVHGDAKPSQFLLDEETTALLDFDHCGLADPLYDVGAFIAAMRKTSVMGSFRNSRRDRREPGGEGRRLEQLFVDTYADAAQLDDDFEERAGWHQAAALVRKALRAYARAPRSPLPRILADESARCLAPSPGSYRSGRPVTMA